MGSNGFADINSLKPHITRVELHVHVHCTHVYMVCTHLHTCMYIHIIIIIHDQQHLGYTCNYTVHVKDLHFQ